MLYGLHHLVESILADLGKSDAVVESLKNRLRRIRQMVLHDESDPFQPANSRRPLRNGS